MKWHLAAVFGMILLEASHGAESLPPLKETPQNIKEVWSGYDPALEPIKARVVREWEEEDVLSDTFFIPSGILKESLPSWRASMGFPPDKKTFQL